MLTPFVVLLLGACRGTGLGDSGALPQASVEQIALHAGLASACRAYRAEPNAVRQRNVADTALQQAFAHIEQIRATTPWVAVLRRVTAVRGDSARVLLQARTMTFTAMVAKHTHADDALGHLSIGDTVAALFGNMRLLSPTTDLKLCEQSWGVDLPDMAVVHGPPRPAKH